MKCLLPPHPRWPVWSQSCHGALVSSHISRWGTSASVLGIWVLLLVPPNKDSLRRRLTPEQMSLSFSFWWTQHRKPMWGSIFSHKRWVSYQDPRSPWIPSFGCPAEIWWEKCSFLGSWLSCHIPNIQALVWGKKKSHIPLGTRRVSPVALSIVSSPVSPVVESSFSISAIPKWIYKQPLLLGGRSSLRAEVCHELQQVHVCLPRNSFDLYKSSPCCGPCPSTSDLFEMQ